MITTLTPLRLELTGGSDLPAFCRTELGAIVNVTINHYVRTSLHPNQPQKKAADSLTQAAWRFLKTKPFAFRSRCDLPTGSGLGSSGSFLVGLLAAVYRHQNIIVPPQKLAKQAFFIEHQLAGIKCGCQDHLAAAWGGLRIHHFYPDGKTTSQLINCPPQTARQLQNNLLLYYFGPRQLTINLLDNLWHKLETDPQARNLMSQRVKLSHQIARDLERGQLKNFPVILKEEWRLKTVIAPQETNPQIDDFYRQAKKAGALAGKLLGAGGGGFFLLYAPLEKQPKIKRALLPFQPTAFAFEPRGCRVE